VQQVEKQRAGGLHDGGACGVDTAPPANAAPRPAPPSWVLGIRPPAAALTFRAEAIMRALAWTLYSMLSLTSLMPCCSLASAKRGSIHTLRFLSALS
jgi:hypothetical protein